MRHVYLAAAMTLAAIPASAAETTRAVCEQFAAAGLAKVTKLLASLPTKTLARLEATFGPGRAAIVELLDDFEGYSSGGFSYLDWTPCDGTDLATLGYTMTGAEREALRRFGETKEARKAAPAKPTIPDDPLAGAATSFEVKVGRSSYQGDRYALPGIICATADDAVLQVLGNSNKSCRHWGGGWLSRWKLGAFRAGGWAAISVNWVKMEIGQTGFVPDVTSGGMPTIGCGEMLASRRHIPGGGSVDPHCVGHNGVIVR